MKARDHGNGSTASFNAKAKPLVRLFLPDAVLKRDECSCTLKTRLDVQLHYCDQFETMQNRRGVDPFERCML